MDLKLSTMLSTNLDAVIGTSLLRVMARFERRHDYLPGERPCRLDCLKERVSYLRKCRRELDVPVAQFLQAFIPPDSLGGLFLSSLRDCYLDVFEREIYPTKLDRVLRFPFAHARPCFRRRNAALCARRARLCARACCRSCVHNGCNLCVSLRARCVVSNVLSV